MNAAFDNSASQPRAAWAICGDGIPQASVTLKPLAEGLAARGVELTIICGSHAPQGAFDGWPADVIRLPMRRWFRPARAISRLASELRERGVRILHALDAEAGGTTSLLAGELNCEHVVSSRRLGDGRLIGKMPVRPTLVLAAGLGVKLDLVNSNCIRPDRILVIPPAISHVDRTDRSAGRSRYRYVVTSDVFDDYRAAAAVLDAFARLDGTDTECLFFAVGNGPAEHTLRKHAEELGLSESLTFVDRLAARQLAGVFQAADIYISPRAADGINIDALLAMASGAAVMAPEDYVSDFIIDGKTASMFRSRDAGDIAEHLADMLKNRRRTASLADGALAYLDRNHHPGRTAEKVLAAYRTVLAAKPDRVPLSA